MKKKLLQLSLSFIVASMNAGTPWAGVANVFEKLGTASGELDKSIDFFQTRTVLIDAFTDKIVSADAIRKAFSDCTKSTFSKLNSDITTCLQNYSNTQTLLGGKISNLTSQIETLKASTAAEIATLNGQIAALNDTRTRLQNEYNSLLGMNQTAVDQAIAGLDAAKAKFVTCTQKRLEFATKLDGFLTKIYQYQGLDKADMQALQKLICQNQ
ncbi:hypothetical protein JST56_01235 [Candidatus Dependentiae bacterium]|nr:hypothetical protein [Candidatus Dependentiae bacterium]